MQQSFGDWLRDTLARMGLSQRRLSQLTGADKGTVNHWIHDRRLPSPQMCQEIADALNIDRDTVLAIADYRPMDEALDPNAPELALIAKIKRIKWNPEMVRLVGGLLDDLVSLQPKVRQQLPANLDGEHMPNHGSVGHGLGGTTVNHH